MVSIVWLVAFAHSASMAAGRSMVDSVKIEIVSAPSDVRVVGSRVAISSGRVVRQRKDTLVVRAPVSLRSDLSDSGLVIETVDTLAVVSVHVTTSYGAVVSASADRLVIRWGAKGLEVFGAPRPVRKSHTEDPVGKYALMVTRMADAWAPIGSS
jgi:hypothetical protein